MKTNPEKKVTAANAKPAAKEAPASKNTKPGNAAPSEEEAEEAPKKGASKAGGKKAAPAPKKASKSSQDEEDDDQMEDDDFELDKDFEEFDLPRSKRDALNSGSGKSKGRSKKDLDDDDDMDDFKDLGFDSYDDGGSDDDDY